MISFCESEGETGNAVLRKSLRKYRNDLIFLQEKLFYHCKLYERRK